MRFCLIMVQRTMLHLDSGVDIVRNLHFVTNLDIIYGRIIKDFKIKPV
jgi:hypothetical protein